jgi:hypothetical protein
LDLTDEEKVPVKTEPGTVCDEVKIAVLEHAVVEFSSIDKPTVDGKNHFVSIFMGFINDPTDMRYLPLHEALWDGDEETGKWSWAKLQELIDVPWFGDLCTCPVEYVREVGKNVVMLQVLLLMTEINAFLARYQAGTFHIRLREKGDADKGIWKEQIPCLHQWK